MQLHRFKDELHSTGFCRFEPADLLGMLSTSPSFESDRDLLLAEAAMLDRDPHDPNGVRHRRYAQAVFVPWTRTLTWYPGLEIDGCVYTEYFQGIFNPDHTDTRRRLVRFSDALLRSRLITSLVNADFTMTSWSDAEARLPMQVGLTMIKLAPTCRTPTSQATPDALHQDGERYTFAHLVTRFGVTGGDNVIADRECTGLHPSTLSGEQILVRFTLEKFFEGYGINDPLVSHHVDHVSLDIGERVGERCIMLIDFTPMRPEHHLS